MFRLRRRLTAAATAAVLLLPAAASAARIEAGAPPLAQEPPRHPPRAPERQAEPRRPPDERRPSPAPPPRTVRPQRPIVVRGEVFVGGYFYDPLYGAYPWWYPWHYPYAYAPIYDVRAMLRVKATPKDAAVYVDGFYAGVVDDFDGVFQGLPLTPGGHAIMLFRPGLRTERHHLYLRSGATFTLRATMAPLPPGQAAELPPTAVRVPPPPRPDSYRLPVQRWPGTDREDAPRPMADAPSGSLDLRVQPAGATVLIDGERWFTSDPGRIIAELPAGLHRLRVSAPGFATADVDVNLAFGERREIAVSLVPES